MATGPDKSTVGPLLVVVGPTASGKTALAIDLAKKFNGEVICADSRTVYEGMDIGTAKPTADEMDGIPHHLLSIVTPDQKFSVADFKQAALGVIDDIGSRGKLPILVGGSGLYIDSVLYDFTFRPVNDHIRETFKDASVDELQAELNKQGIELPENSLNRRYLLRSLEAGGPSHSSSELRPNTLVVGLAVDQEILKQRIEKRVHGMLEAGLVNEVKQLATQYNWELPAMQAPAYKAFRSYVEDTVELEQAIADFVMYDSRLAKKQRTWFKRNNSIHWVTDPSNVVDLVTTFLNTR